MGIITSTCIPTFVSTIKGNTTVALHRPLFEPIGVLVHEDYENTRQTHWSGVGVWGGPLHRRLSRRCVAVGAPSPGGRAQGGSPRAESDIAATGFVLESRKGMLGGKSDD